MQLDPEQGLAQALAEAAGGRVGGESARGRFAGVHRFEGVLDAGGSGRVGAMSKENRMDGMDAFVQAAGSMGIEVGLVEQERVARYVELLLRWNERLNLTSIRSPRELLAVHILDSMVAGGLLDGSETLIDLGAGGGLPGIPIKIMHPGVRLVLVEATRKKVSFLRDVIRRIGLAGAEARWSRAEDPQLAASFVERPADCVVTRAALKDEDALRAGGALVRPGGRVVLMKGAVGREDLDRLRALCLSHGFCQKQVVPYRLSGLQKARHLIVLERGIAA